MKLIFPEKKFYPSYLSAISEYQYHNITAYEFLNPDNGDIFRQIEDFRTGRNLPAGYVSATYLWLVDNNEFTGEISIRHSLTDSLLR